MRPSADKNLLYSYCYNRFLAWESTFQNLGNSHSAGKRTRSVKGIILGDVNNDSVLSQEHNQSGIVVSGIPSTEAQPKNNLQNTCKYARL